MKNTSLTKDYLQRAKSRLRAVDVLFEEKAWADVVRESQEIVELTLKALLRYSRIESPRIHDVSDVLIENKQMLPKELLTDLDKICEISRSLRRDRELAFYGSEDLTPSDFYKEKDAKLARKSASWVLEIILRVALV